MSGFDFIARALALSAKQNTPRRFASLADGTLSGQVERIESSGHWVAGSGMATYVRDDTITSDLMAKHPLAVFAASDGAKFRLTGTPDGFVTPEMLGCPPYAVGINQQPYIQAAITYAEAVGLKGVLLTQPAYELWCPIRNSGLNLSDPSGNYLVVRKNLFIRGQGKERVLLKCLNSQGGTNDTITQPNPGYDSAGGPYNGIGDWIGSAVYLYPDNDAKTIDFFKMENVEIDGTRTYDSALNNPANSNWTQKGLRLQNRNCYKIEMRNVTIRNMSGEIYYLGGAVVREELLENVILDGSAQCCLNPGTGAKGTYINLQCGNAYQCEIMAGAGKRFIGGRFYNMTLFSFMGGAAGAGGNYGLASGYPFWWPLRPDTGGAPWSQFDGTRFENVSALSFGSFVQGNINVIDGQLGFSPNSSGRQSDVNLTVNSVCDRRTSYNAISIGGPSDLVTQAPSAPAGVYIEPLKNIYVRLLMSRTRNAIEKGYQHTSGVRVNAGLYDAPTVRITVDGTATFPFDVQGTPPSGFVWPRIDVAATFCAVVPGNNNATQFMYPSTAGPVAVTPRPGDVIMFEPTVNGTFDLSLVNTTYPAQAGAKLRLISKAAVSRYLRIAASGAGCRLQADRVLWLKGDYLDLVWDSGAATWVEAGYSTQQKLEFTGSFTFSAAQTVAATSSFSFAITLTGATATDQSSGTAWTAYPSGLLKSEQMTAANTMTVTLYNPTAAPITVASGTQVTGMARKRL